MDTYSFTIHIKTEDFYKDIANDVEKWFDTSNCDEDDKRPLPVGKNKQVIGLFKYELGGKTMEEFFGLRAKTYAYLMDDNTEKKKVKGTKKAFIEYSNDMQDVYKNIGEYSPGKERKILIAFYDMIADMINNKKLNSVVTELFIRSRKLNISLVSNTQSYFKVPKDVRLNFTPFFIIKIPKKGELQQIALNH